MRKFERLSNIFFGVEMFNGEIDLSKHRERIFFFIVEHTTDKEYIEKQAMQLLVAGCRDFHFFGAKEPLWHLTFDEVDIMMYPNSTSENVALTSNYITFDDFVDEIKLCINCRYFLPTDIYLVYDDKSLYQNVLQALKIYNI